MPPAARNALAALVVFLAVCADGIPRGLARLAARPEPWGADAPAYCRIGRQVIARGTLRLPPPDRIDRDVQQDVTNVWGTPYALGRGGVLYPKHPWLFALLLVPGLWLAGIPGAFVTAVLLGAGLLAYGTWRAARVFGALPSALAGLALFFLVPAVRTVCLAINVDTAIAFAALYALAAAADRRFVAAGLVAGFSLLLRPTMPLLLAPAALLVLGTRDRRALARAAAGLAPGVVVLLGSNALLWGSPFASAYGRAAVLENGTLHAVSVAGGFGGSVFAGLATLFLHPDAGLLFTAPFALAALLGYALPEARRPEWLWGALAGGAALLALAPYEYLPRVPVSNVRFALPLLVFALFPLAALLSRARRPRGRSGSGTSGR